MPQDTATDLIDLRTIRALLNFPSGLFSLPAHFLTIDDGPAWHAGEVRPYRHSDGGLYRVQAIYDTEDGITYLHRLETLEPPAMRAEAV